MTPSANAAGSPAPNESGPARVMIVDDSTTIRRVLTRWFEQAGGFEVVAAHGNGRRAADDVVKAKPDLVVLDIEMPEMDGLTALPLILERRPGTIVIVASTLSRRGAEVTLRALTLGAADYLTKPDAGSIGASERFRDDLLAKARSLAARKRRRNAPAPRPALPASRSTARPQPVAGPARPRAAAAGSVRALLIGSSTGGPQALTRIFGEIGAAIAGVPVLLTQHMPPTFTAILAEHLGRAAGRPAAEAADGEPLRPGRIYVAPGGRHMLVAGTAAVPVVRLTDDPPVNFCRPAVDPLFESAAAVFGAGALALVLTGMGSDGARGAMSISRGGGVVAVQDEATSVVWGMPGAVVAAGVSPEVLPLGEIAPWLARTLVRRPA